jgi:hypothetical protein
MWIRKVNIYRLPRDFQIKTPVEGEEYNEGYFKLTSDGVLLVRSGFEWNGASPKFRIGRKVIGTPEGAVGATGYPKTFYPTLVHDVLYTLPIRAPRRRVDLFFLTMLRREKFILAPLYYMAVRIFGKGAFHGGN